MKLEQQQIFDKAPETVIRMFGDRTYFERKYAALGLRDAQVIEHEQKDGYIRIRVRYTAQSEVPLPDFARKLVPGDVSVEQEDRWDLSACTGRIEVILHGLPFKIVADTKLLAHGENGAVNIQNWDIRCSIPLVGAKLEKLMLDDIKAKADADLAASRKILLDY